VASEKSEIPAFNVVILRGVLARPPQQTELPSGSLLASFEVTVRRDEGPAETVPVTWMSPPAWATVMDAGTQVVVSGRVRRRFFRTAGATQSRTEVVASEMVKATARAKVKRLLADALEAIHSAEPLADHDI
jgi:single-strand DNA-binding protein